MLRNKHIFLHIIYDYGSNNIDNVVYIILLLIMIGKVNFMDSKKTVLLIVLGFQIVAMSIAYCTLTVTYKDQTNQNSGNAGQVQTYTREAHATLDVSWKYIQKFLDN